MLQNSLSKNEKKEQSTTGTEKEGKKEQSTGMGTQNTTDSKEGADESD